MPKKRLLHIDIEGGALWGIHAAITLEGMEREAGKPIAHLADIFSGVSSGAMVSMLLNIPDKNNPTIPAYSATDAVNGILKNGPDFFPPTKFYDLGHYFNRYAMQIKNGMTGSSSQKTLFSDAIKHDVYHSFYGDLQMSDSMKSQIIHTHLLHAANSNDSDTGHPLSSFKQDFIDRFCTIRAPQSFHENTAILDAVMGSTAAPTVYPAHKFGDKTLIDPGLQHSPSFSADEVLPFLDPDVEYMFMFIGTGCTRQPTEKSIYDRFGIIDMLRGDKGAVLLRTISTNTKTMGLRSLRNRLGDDHVIDISKSLVPSNEEEKLYFPSDNQIDARPENLEKMLEFGEKQFNENRDQILRAIDFASGEKMPQNWNNPNAKNSRVFFTDNKKGATFKAAP